MAIEVRTQNSAASAHDFAAITPSDTIEFQVLPSGLYVGGAGNVVVVTNANVAVTFTAVLAGSVLPIKYRRINATGTTATNLVAMF